MIITVDEATVISQRFPDLPLIYLNPVESTNNSGKRISIPENSLFKPEHKSVLKEYGIDEIKVIYTEMLYSKLISLNSIKYRKPSNKGSFVDIDKILMDYKEFNSKSKRQRYLISCSEQYTKTPKGRLVPLMNFGENITFEKWQNIKTKINKKKQIYFRHSENGIIVLVDLRPGGEDYLQRFYKNSDLVTSLVGKKSTDKIVISPDFIGSADVISVDDPQKLLPEYSGGNWKLIIVGDTLSKDYTEAMQTVKSFDRYARFMMATNIDLRKKDDFILSVKEQYNTDKWSS